MDKEVSFIMDKEVSFSFKYKISFDNFSEFNNKIAMKYLKKYERKSKIFGSIEIAFSLSYMMFYFIDKTKVTNGFMILSLIVFLLGLFSLSYYPIFFKRKLNKKIVQVYNSYDYFKNDIFLDFYDNYLVEKSIDNENKRDYKDYNEISQTENIIAILNSQTSGIIIPKKYVKNEKEFLSFLENKIKNNK